MKMKPPLKFTIFSILHFSKSGVWEHEIYNLLKPHYNKRALSKVRTILIEMHNKSWTEEVDVSLYDKAILRKYKMQKRHEEFVEYQISPQTILDELGISLSIDLAKGGEVIG